MNPRRLLVAWAAAVALTTAVFWGAEPGVWEYLLACALVFGYICAAVWPALRD